MDFDENAQIDTSQVEDVRGSGGGGGFGGGGMGFPIPVGGGIVGLLLAVVLGVVGVNGGIPGLNGGSNSADNRSLQEKCATTNRDRFKETECRQVATFEDLRAFWRTTAPDELGVEYADPRLVLFSGGVNTACGSASSAVGPFYCPGDQRIYIDLGFYDQLSSQFGAQGEFAQSYVIAHEFGHHIQYLTGAERQVRSAQQDDPGNANEYSIALELQADCYAGVWSKDAAGEDGLITGVSDDDLRSAMSAAEAVGDDRIQEKTQGQVNPETWTHGSSEQRQEWFFTGYQSGDARKCNTFN